MSEHVCSHPRCKVPVPARMLACAHHWFLLPRHLRSAVWATYQPGRPPSSAYLEAVTACITFWEMGSASRSGGDTAA